MRALTGQFESKQTEDFPSCILSGMSRRQLPLLIAAVLLVAVVSLVVDQNTGDTTGPPYDDSLLNVASFCTFLVSMVIFVGLCIVGLVVWLRHRLGPRPSARN
jgi:hypothetical protein